MLLPHGWLLGLRHTLPLLWSPIGLRLWLLLRGLAPLRLLTPAWLLRGLALLRLLAPRLRFLLLILILVLLLIVLVLLLLCVIRSSDPEQQEQSTCTDKYASFHLGSFHLGI